jgi:hypothetical protein
MANEVDDVSAVITAFIANISGITDANMAKIAGLEFTGVSPTHVLLGTATASSSATLAFEGVMDDTYDIYEFHFINMHPASDAAFGFQVNAVDEAGYNEVMMTQTSLTSNREDGSATVYGYHPSIDQDDGTGYQVLSKNTSSGDNDSNVSGVLTTFAFGRNTTLFKNFYFRALSMNDDDGSSETFQMVQGSGQIVTTKKVDDISFAFASGNIDSGVIKMYGIIIT